MGQTAFLVLDRPTALNAINLAMADAIANALKDWWSDPGITRIVIDSSAPRAFCAGGDLRQIRDRLLGSGADAAAAQFRRVYDLFADLVRSPVPVISLMDGIAMGGGIGLGGHARYRIVTERSILAMPETLIGLTPDAGGSWLLARAPGFTGLRLALTAGRIEGAAALGAGFADYAVPSADLDTLRDALARDMSVEDALARVGRLPVPQ
ncbi:enoyl-CoA hydratase/isomerase family protein, partial [Ameyamaea chiangmaiensis]|nr:enoyl-CoA hydratase/isomerase family protein [Ameyamaea chiangmaiensis]